MLNEQALRSIGFNDPQVISYILNNPQERNRYERELGGVTTTPSGQFAFDFPTELDRAYGDLESYYDRLLKESRGDTDLALSRLTEDYNTGKRFRETDASLSRESLALAQENLSASFESARDILTGTQQRRGIYRTSGFNQDQNMGIATQEQQKLEAETARRQRGQDLGVKQLDTNLAQSEELAARDVSRGTTDLKRGQERYEFGLGEERKQRAQELASSRAQRAFQRFESGLV